MKDSLSQGLGGHPCGEQPEPAVTATAALADRWMTLNRAGMIETFREWADNQMKRHDDPSTPQGLRDAAFWQAMALYEVAETIEAGEFDPVRPADGASSRPTGQLRDEPIPFSLTDEMVEAGALALAVARWRREVEGVTQQERDQARACLEAAMAVRGETK